MRKSENSEQFNIINASEFVVISAQRSGRSNEINTITSILTVIDIDKNYLRTFHKFKTHMYIICATEIT